jgi:hypothetical protein
MRREEAFEGKIEKDKKQIWVKCLQCGTLFLLGCGTYKKRLGANKCVGLFHNRHCMWAYKRIHMKGIKIGDPIRGEHGRFVKKPGVGDGKGTDK